MIIDEFSHSQPVLDGELVEVSVPICSGDEFETTLLSLLFKIHTRKLCL